MRRRRHGRTIAGASLASDLDDADYWHGNDDRRVLRRAAGERLVA